MFITFYIMVPCFKKFNNCHKFIIMSFVLIIELFFEKKRRLDLIDPSCLKLANLELY